jgi:hypothetical protein
MILVNQKQLLVGEALADKFNPLHAQAVEYENGLKELREQYGKEIKFVRPGYPKFNPGMDSEGRASTMLEPTTPAAFPLKTYLSHPTRGKETWACCLDFPVLQANGLWEMGRKRSISIFDFITVNIDRDPDLAFYLYKICNATKDGRLAVDNPKAAIRAKANKAREDTELQVAIWNVLKDEPTLVRIAQAWGIAEASTKDPDALRFELKELLARNDEKKKLDPSTKGTKEFLAELKITDSIRLRAFLRDLLDNKTIIHKPDGRVWIGEKNLMQIPYAAINDVFDYICNFYGSQNNIEKLRDLMRDVVSKEMLDGIVDEKDFNWIGKVIGVEVSFKKKEDVKKAVYESFNIDL